MSINPYALCSLLTGLLFLSACSDPTPESASFIATLGQDTLVIEQFTMQPERVEAEVIIRTPRTSYMKQILEMDKDGNFSRYHSASYDPKDITSATPLAEETVAIDGDSLVVIRKRGDQESSSKFAYDPSILPWVDMVHWPYEVATRHLTKSGASSSDQLMLSGRNPAVFEIRTLAPDSVSIKHPYRGTMYARIDEHGAIQYYDATSTTRKLIVKRSGAVDMPALAARFADNPVGSLSGEGETQANVLGAEIKLTFGQPAKRGRELFGGIVPWNERWRTGANRATHFSTDKDLMIGELAVPAGEYTLFSIPQPDGGTLIINKQTGQNGNSYDESRDLGRVPMNLTTQDESVELFTIDAVERAGKGVLQLKWGETILEVPFEVAVE